MKLLSDEQIRDLLFTSPANSYVEAFRVVVEAQLESCEKECIACQKANSMIIPTKDKSIQYKGVRYYSEDSVKNELASLGTQAKFELQAERERIIQEIGLLLGEMPIADKSKWRSLKVRIREGV